MSKYLFIYHGGVAPVTDEDKEKVMGEWSAWFDSMGTAVIDGGNPLGMSTTVLADGHVEDNGGSNPASGFSTIQAEDTENAIVLAKECPIFKGGGSVELARCYDM